MSRTWFISDTHFGHKNIITYENRPFANTDEMDEAIIRNWNSVVASDDVVWFLGDLALGNKDNVRAIVPRLKGNKRMIRGNHDRWSDEFYREIGFQFVSKYPVILKGFFVLSHAPMEYMGKTSPFFFLYGHVHSSPSYSSKTENSCCVCLERWNYTPIQIVEYNEYSQETTQDLEN